MEYEINLIRSSFKTWCKNKQNKYYNYLTLFRLLDGIWSRHYFEWQTLSLGTAFLSNFWLTFNTFSSSLFVFLVTYIGWQKCFYPFLNDWFWLADAWIQKLCLNPTTIIRIVLQKLVISGRFSSSKPFKSAWQRHHDKTHRKIKDAAFLH